jgi:uncharacterized GH25 family protein
MKKTSLTIILVLAWVGIFNAHDMFLKLDSFFLKPHSDVSISLFNGTFEKSENVITRDRMVDVSIVGPGKELTIPDTSQWRDVGTKTVLDFKTGASGTYIVGVSTAPRMIELSAKDFNDYLTHDGVIDVLAARKREDEMETDARERYSKHVKSIMQVGDDRSNSFETRLGYPVELIPQQNPYDLKKGEILEVLFLRSGKPVANQLIYASYEGYHDHGEEGEHREAIQTRTDEKGIARVQLKETGQWYLRLIHMVKVDEEDADYESNWATLTFEVR